MKCWQQLLTKCSTLIRILAAGFVLTLCSLHPHTLHNSSNLHLCTAGSIDPVGSLIIHIYTIVFEWELRPVTDRVVIYLIHRNTHHSWLDSCKVFEPFLSGGLGVPPLRKPAIFDPSLSEFMRASCSIFYKVFFNCASSYKVFGICVRQHSWNGSYFALQMFAYDTSKVGGIIMRFVYAIFNKYRNPVQTL